MHKPLFAFAAVALTALLAGCSSLAQPQEITVTKEPLSELRGADAAPGAARPGGAAQQPAAVAPRAGNANAERAMRPSCGE